MTNVKYGSNMKIDESAGGELSQRKDGGLSYKTYFKPLFSQLSRRYRDARRKRIDVLNDRSLRAEQVFIRIKSLGLSRIALTRWEPLHLYGYLHPYEKVYGVVYGKTEDGGRALLAATNARILYIDRNGFLTTMDEIPFDMVSGVSYTRNGIFGIAVTLHTRTKDYSLVCYKALPAENFVNFIEVASISNEKLINFGNRVNNFGNLRVRKG